VNKHAPSTSIVLRVVSLLFLGNQTRGNGGQWSRWVYEIRAKSAKQKFTPEMGQGEGVSTKVYLSSDWYSASTKSSKIGNKWEDFFKDTTEREK